MKDLNEINKKQEKDLLFWAMQNAIQDLPIIYTGFGLDYEVADSLLENLYNDYKNSDYLDTISNAIILVRTVRQDLITNKIDLTIMKDLLDSLLTIIEISTKRCK